MVATAVMAGVSLAGGLAGRSSAKKAARRAKMLAKENTRLIRMENKYELANLDKVISDTLGQAKGTLGASGFKMGGTTERAAIDDLEGEFQLQRDWLIASGAQREKIARLGGQAQVKSIEDQGRSQLIGAVGQGIIAAGNFNNWWQ